MCEKLTGYPRDRSPPSLDPPPGVCRTEPTTWHDLDEPEPSTSTSTTEPGRAALEPLSRTGEPVGTRPRGSSSVQVSAASADVLPFPPYAR